MIADVDTSLMLLCRVQTRRCAIPLEHAVETMRPLPVEPVADAPHFIRGLAVIRGAPIPVVDAARLLGAPETRPARFVTLVTGERQVALAVDDVLGIRPISASSLQELPPLLQEAAADAVAAIGTLDADLLLVLRSARLVPEALWQAMEPSGPPA